MCEGASGWSPLCANVSSLTSLGVSTKAAIFQWKMRIRKWLFKRVDIRETLHQHFLHWNTSIEQTLSKKAWRDTWLESQTLGFKRDSCSIFRFISDSDVCYVIHELLKNPLHKNGKIRVLLKMSAHLKETLHRSYTIHITIKYWHKLSFQHLLTLLFFFCINDNAWGKEKK